MKENHDAPAAPKPPEHPQEPLLDLKAEREARGLSLSDIFHATRVSLVNLTALESWDFERLPPPVYTRNFIRKYAQTTGIDEKTILNRYERHLKAISPPPAETEATKSRAKTGRLYLLIFACLFIAIAAAVAVYSRYLDDRAGSLLSPDRPDASTPEAQTVPPSPLEAPPAAPTTSRPQPTPTAQATTGAKPQIPLGQRAAAPSSSERPAGKPLHLVIEARELTWARITADHSPSQVLLQPGERIERWASDFFQLDIGNAGGIDVIFQGKPMGSLGKRGEVVHVRLPDGQRAATTP